MSREDMIRALLFLGLISLVYFLEVRIWFGYILGRIKRIPDARRILLGKSAMCVHTIAVFGILCAAYGYWIEPYWIQVRRIELHSPKLTNTSFRVVQISDTHCDRKPRNEAKVVEIINALNPDIIVFTGDSLNDLQALPRFQEMLRSLKASKGKFALRGNIDNRYFPTVDLFADTGFRELKGGIQTIEIQNESVTLSGLAYQGQASFSHLPEKLGPATFNIFLYHTPSLADYAPAVHVDLYLAGHTHGGQIALPFFGAIITLSPTGKKYESGMYGLSSNSYSRIRSPVCEYGRVESVIYVNRGIGMEGGRAPRVRFCARPEITVLDIRPSADRQPIPSKPAKDAPRP